MARFKVGDVVVFVKCVCHAHGTPVVPYGAELTILAVFDNHPKGLVYEVDVPNPFGGNYRAMECYLIPKRPPPHRQELGSWAECPWRPALEVTHD